MVVAVLLVERFGRKPLLLVSSVLSCISVYTLAIYFYLEENVCPQDDPGCTSGISEDLLNKLSWIPLVTLIIFVMGMNMGLGPLPWMMNGEMYSEEAKSISAALATATNWTTTFLVTKFSTNLTNAIKNSGTYFVYGSVCFACSIFVIFVVPETKGKSIQDMKEYFEGNKKHSILFGNENIAIEPEELPVKCKIAK
jgi:MFS family permease